MTANDLAQLSDQDLELRLLDLAMRDDIGGHRAQAQSSAIRTVLRRRRERAEADTLECRARAVEIVNDVRRGHRDFEPVDVGDMDAGWAACIVEDHRWAPLYATRREMVERREAMMGDAATPGG